MDNSSPQSPHQAPIEKTQQSPRLSPASPKKTLIIILSLFFFLLIGIGGYLIAITKIKSPQTKQNLPASQTTSQPSPTINSASPAPNGVGANWKTYKSLCGFTIKYPFTWKIAGPAILSECGIILGPNAVIDKQPVPSIVGLYLDIQKTKVKLGDTVNRETHAGTEKVVINNLDNYIQTKFQDFDCANPQYIQDKTFGNLSGKYYLSGLDIDTCPQDNTIYHTFIFTQSNEIYEIIWPKKYVENYQDNINQILSTFKFTEEIHSSLAPKQFVTKSLGRSRCSEGFLLYDNAFLSICIPEDMKIGNELVGFPEDFIKISFSNKEESVDITNDVTLEGYCVKKKETIMVSGMSVGINEVYDGGLDENYQVQCDNDLIGGFYAITHQETSLRDQSALHGYISFSFKVQKKNDTVYKRFRSILDSAQFKLAW